MPTEESHAQRRVELLEKELQAVYGSSSYKIGRAVTWLPRALRGGAAFARRMGGAAGVVRYWRAWRKYTPLSGKKHYAYWMCLPPQHYEEALKEWFEQNSDEELDLQHPVTYNQKAQWLKLHDDLKMRTLLSDKYLVRDWVKDKIGEEYLIPLLGVWDRFDEIDFDALPDKFALKANHGSGWNIIVPDKAKFDRADAKRKFDTWMQLNYAYMMGGLELQYRDIKPRILAEQYLENEGGELYDYKFFCFDGKVHYIKYVCGRYNDRDEQMVFFDRDWNRQKFNYIVPYTEPDVPRPQNLEKMIQLSETLSAGFPCVRVDLYQLADGTIQFGEMTFTTYGGIPEWHPASANRMMGDLIHLPGIDDAPAGTP